MSGGVAAPIGYNQLDKHKTQIPMQLVTPRVVPMAVKIAMSVCTMNFHVSLVIFIAVVIFEC